MYELKIILQSSHLKCKDSWEQCRMIAYTTAQVNSSKKLKETDIMQFAWDDKETVTITEEDKKKAKQKAEEIIKELNKNI